MKLAFWMASDFIRKNNPVNAVYNVELDLLHLQFNVNYNDRLLSRE